MIEALWDSSAKAYSEIAPKLAFYQETANKILAKASIQPRMSLVDLAAGSSAILENLILRAVPEIKVIYCVDSSSEMLQELRNKVTNDKIRFIHSAAEHLSQFVPPVHRILCNAAIWNFNVHTAFAEIWRSLQAGGQFLFTIAEWDIKSERALAHPKYDQIDQELRYRGLPPKLSRGSEEKIAVEDLLADLEKTGFKDISTTPFSVSADAHDYELFYQIPAIAAKSLPHIPTKMAVDVLTCAMKRLSGVLPPVSWLLIEACRTS